MPILINTPFLNLPAGVSNHYTGLKPYWSKQVRYNIYTTRYKIQTIVKNNFLQIIARAMLIPYDYLKFTLKLLSYDIDVVLLNPSFHKSSLTRDKLYLIIAKAFHKKVAVFIHGWDIEYAKKVITNPRLIEKYKKADAFFVLANEFKEYLNKMGIITNVYLTTTKVDDRLIRDFNISEKRYDSKRLLFVGRVEKSKGIYTAINAFQQIKQKHKKATFTIVGNGKELNDIIKHIDKNNIKDIFITGALFGERLIREFQNACLYILPSESEGMPTTVLEAMAFGLPIISRPVGGLKDFFEEDKMGYLTESREANEFAKIIDILFENSDRAETIGRFNHSYAKNNFLASHVAEKMEQSLNQLKNI